MKFYEYYHIEDSLLVEGGGYGHLLHPFEDNDLTFGEMKEMITKTLTGDLKTTQEKTDGQNIMITWKNGKLRAARNKGHIKNQGANSLDLDGITKMFDGRGEIQDAFTYAFKDLQSAIGALPDETVNNIFEDGKKFMSVEVIYPQTENVIPYDASLLVPHGVIEYDMDGNAIGEDKDSAREMFKIIQETNNAVQSHFRLRPPHDIQGLKIVDFKEQQDKFFNKINRVLNKYDLSDTNTLLDYKKEWWRNYITKIASEFETKLSDEALQLLVDRWSENKKSITISMIKELIDSNEFVVWMDNFDKNKLASMQKTSVKPFELLFLDLGVTILKNMKQFLALNPDKSLKRIKDNLSKHINTLKDRDDLSQKDIDKLEYELNRLEQIGGLENIVPTEGITFMFGNKVYKLTGTFAPVNAILGMGRY
ncbi:MAG: hypothetical protein WC260_01515 [Candidatus Pacearchaeota archaeon]